MRKGKGSEKRRICRDECKPSEGSEKRKDNRRRKGREGVGNDGRRTGRKGRGLEWREMNWEFPRGNGREITGYVTERRKVAGSVETRANGRENGNESRR